MNTLDRIIVSLCGELPGLSVLVSPAQADDTLVTTHSHYTVAETIDRIVRAVTGKGMLLFARPIMRTRRGRSGWKCLPTELLIFGNPKGGRPFMLAAPTVVIDLPMKALAWQDQAWRVWLTYNAPALLSVRHGLAAALAVRLDPVGHGWSAPWTNDGRCMLCVGKNPEED